MDEPVKRTRMISFRLTDDEYQQINSAASARGDNPNDWCRTLALTATVKGDGLSRNERLVYEELARVRYLLAKGFGMLAAGELTPSAWDEQRNIADSRGDKIADKLIGRRQQER